MPSALWETLILEIREACPDAVIIPFWRGESLMHPDFCEMINFALQNNIRVHLSTNGHYWDDEIVDLLRKIEFLTFSIHSDIGFKNAKQFVDNSKSGNNPITQISFVECEKTAEKYLPEVMESSNLLGFDSVRLYKEHTIDGNFGSSNQGKSIPKRKFCQKLTNTLVIAADGEVSRCNHLWKTEKIFNDEDNSYSIEKIWNSDQFYDIRTNYPDQKCSACDQWTGHTLGEVWQYKNGKVIHKVFSNV
jgi:radical SAM protein with 4Fe4S-binding SPASM domain